MLMVRDEIAREIERLIILTMAAIKKTNFLKAQLLRIEEDEKLR